VNYLSVANWERFQHYGERRNPPWIKLHRSLLDDFSFSCLSDTQKLHLMLIWLLASQVDNRIPNDPAWIKRRIGVNAAVDLNSLIQAGFLLLEQDASNVLSKCSSIISSSSSSSSDSKKKDPGFTPPTLEEVEDRAREMGYDVDALAFHSFYQSKDWMVGKSKMKDWQASLTGWWTRDGKRRLSGFQPTDHNAIINAEASEHSDHKLWREYVRGVLAGKVEPGFVAWLISSAEASPAKTSATRDGAPASR
jgi:hypothetical protein